MRKVLVILFVLLVGAKACPCMAKDNTADDLMSLIKLNPEAATPDKITNLLGKPARIEESKKRTSWFYTVGDNEVKVCWSKKSERFEKFSFSCMCKDLYTFDNRLSRKLQSGSTNLAQTIQLLGMPRNMTVKTSTQELHYAYNKNVLRLFFRNNILVDFTLLGQNG